MNEAVNPFVVEIRNILYITKVKIVQTRNNELIVSYWKIGEVIVCDKQNDSISDAKEVLQYRQGIKLGFSILEEKSFISINSII